MSMLATIQPSVLSGAILAPASKSSMQRACAAALLRAGETIIRHPGHSNDERAALGVIRDLGANVASLDDGSLWVSSSGVTAVEGMEVNCGESGLGLRMFAPIIGLSGRMVRVRGEGSLLNRPMDFFDKVFPQLGIRVVSNQGKLPLEIRGPLKPRDIGIDGSLSSQFLTGLLFAYSAARATDVSIRVSQLKSKPYIDLTLFVMKHFGWRVENRDYQEFYFDGETSGDAGSGVLEYTVEGDWSGGAFLLVAGAIAGSITVRGLDSWSTQADKAILQALCDCGAQLETGEEQIRIGPGRMKAFRFDATDCPDLFPPLVALAAHCEGTTVISGVSRLAHKESNRGLTLQEEFGKMGIAIDLAGDTMLVRGGPVKGARVHSRHDHRIAMACAVGALRADGEVIIEEAQAINKSYPDFYGDLQQLGGELKLSDL
ncbi:MAG TPA: 3-phosphoshikimate 1-carboxyvinyltransferase [Puia sp.]|jgi:3-phosphoshikimate 1-carboxyvinyltransferase|nr:3-phosphoshikimate 1-carboxyvinyltransferase [Puia sp.]